MIGKVVDSRRDGRSSFSDLLRYMVEREDHAPSGAPEGDSWMPSDASAPDVFGTGPVRALVGGVSCETSCTALDTADLEMAGAAAMNPRVKDAVYHFVVSWPDDEKPDDDEAFGAARHALDRLGMADHQYVSAIHRDTGNVHVHVMVNRVHPETYKAQDVSRDFFALDRAMRECEIRYGRKHDNGPSSVVERDGEKVIVWSSEKAHAQGKRPSRARSMERWSGTESFHGYLQGAPRKTVVRLLKDPELTWDKLHTELAGYGLDLRPKGRGLAVYAHDQDVTPVKASDLHEDLSAGRLAKRLGEYQLPPATMKYGREVYRYRRGRELPANELPSQEVPAADRQARIDTNRRREIRRGERAAAREDLKARYKAYRKTFQVQRLDPNETKRRYAALSREHRQVRAQILASMLPSATRKAQYSVAALEAAKRRDELKRKLADERQRLRDDPANRPLTYREWVLERAQEGDAAAVAQLRGWHHADKRAAKHMKALEARIDHAGFAPVDSVPPRDLVVLERVAAHRVYRDGSVSYQVDGRDAFVDHGRVMRMSDAHDLDGARIVAMLVVAREKFGNRFALTGTPAFREAAMQLIAHHHMPIELKDATEAARLREIRDSQIQKHQPELPGETPSQR